MSVFGSRDDDPLLENDPLAPSSDEEEEDETTTDASSETPATDQEPTSNGASRLEDSVFGRAASAESDAEDSSDSLDEEESRVIVRSTAEAADGALVALNEALDDGWRVDRVEINEVSTAERDAEVKRAATSTSLTLAFVLRRVGGE